MARGDKKKIDDLLEAYYLTDSKRKTGKKPTRTDMAREYLANKDLWESVVSQDVNPEQYNERADSFMASMLKGAYESLAPSGKKKLRDSYYTTMAEAPEYDSEGYPTQESFMAGVKRRQAEQFEGQTKRQWEVQQEKIKIQEGKKREKQYKEEQSQWEKEQFKRGAEGREGIRREDYDDMSEYQRARKMRDRYIEEQAGDYRGAPSDSPFGQRTQRQFARKEYDEGIADERTKRVEQLKSIEAEYRALGSRLSREVNPVSRRLIMNSQRDLLPKGLKLSDSLGKENTIFHKDTAEGVLPSWSARQIDTGQRAFKGKDRVSRVGAEVFGQAGTGSFYNRGELFRGTSYASTGAINGVMRALAGIFILFVFIGVFYMVFGPIYDSLIFNFINIVSADGDPTLGGKDIPTLFDNVAKVVLVWVPLIVFAGALYKLTALVFEREVGTRTTEETEWDALLSGEDSMDLDMGSGPEPGVFDAYGGGW